jgi:hypothetical protein
MYEVVLKDFQSLELNWRIIFCYFTSVPPILCILLQESCSFGVRLHTVYNLSDNYANSLEFRV